VLSAFGSFSGANRATYDAFSKIAARDLSQDENIVLVTVDAETVARYGEESFWTRTRYKALLDQIEEAGAKAVYFDYYFSEKTRPENVDWDLLQETAKLPQESLDESYVAYSKAIKSADFTSEIDFDFARTIKRHGNVYLPKLLRNPSPKASSTETVAEPLGIFASNARMGFVNVPLDTDGVERRAYGKIGNEISVPFLLAEAITGKKPDMRLSTNGTYYPKFSGAPYSPTFPVIPFEYAQNGKMTDRVGNPVSLSGKIVIVGDYGETL
jgi:CHASE2 domain-containing sensor protein